MLGDKQYRAAVAAEVGTLARWLHLLGVHEEEIPDALGEVVRVLLANRSAFTGETPFRVFCFGVAARMVGRRRRRPGTCTSVKPQALTETMAQIRSAGPSMEDTIEAALDVLPFRLRVVLVAVEMQRMSLDEVGFALGLPDNSGSKLEARLERARLMFASALQQLEHEGTHRSRGTLLNREGST